MNHPEVPVERTIDPGVPSPARPRSGRPLLAILALACLASPGGAGCAGPRKFAGEISFEAYRLENGLTVILHEDHRLPLVTVNTWYHVGSKDEPPGRSGFAHLFEHLMFMGTRNVPEGEFDRVMEAGGGSNNASTSKDWTNYFESGPANLLETFLFLEADRMRTLGRDINQNKLDRQREVVRNERRQRFENRPYGKVFLEMWPLLYPAGHPYHHTVIGSHEDLERATVEDVKDFFARFYVPVNASLVVAGDFDPAAARRWIERYFGDIPAGSPPPHTTAAPVRLDAPVARTLEDRVELPRTMLVYHSPALYSDGDADLDLLASILGNGKAGRLYRRLVHEKQIAQDVLAYQFSARLGSIFIIQATARPEVDLETIESEIDGVLEEIRARPPTERECVRARNGFETMFWSELESVAGRADLLNQYHFHFGDPGALGRDLARYGKATPASVQHWLKKVLDPEARLILRILPGGNDEESQ